MLIKIHITNVDETAGVLEIHVYKTERGYLCTFAAGPYYSEQFDAYDAMIQRFFASRTSCLQLTGDTRSTASIASIV